MELLDVLKELTLETLLVCDGIWPTRVEHILDECDDNLCTDACAHRGKIWSLNDRGYLDQVLYEIVDAEYVRRKLERVSSYEIDDGVYISEAEYLKDANPNGVWDKSFWVTTNNGVCEGFDSIEECLEYVVGR